MSDVLIRIEGRAGRITLNRPQALNALTYEMVLAIEQALISWESDDQVALVIIEGAGDRAFCAGGDIEVMYKSGRADDFAYGAKFWRDEYRLNNYIASYPKPYVALMHGFVMGGGVGVSAHGSHRIVTDSSMIAMPECSIGLVPDVGGTHILGQMPGYLGEFAGLSGYRLDAGDAIFTGFADYYVPQDRLNDLADTLSETGQITGINNFSQTPSPGVLEALKADIDRVFAKNSVMEIVLELEELEDGWAKNALKSLKRASPISLVCAVRLIRGSKIANDLRTSLEHEYRFVARSMEHGDFLEGIRAAIIDKDRSPKWRYATLDALPDNLIERLLAPVNGPEEKLTWQG